MRLQPATVQTARADGGCGGNARPVIRVGVPDGDLELGADQAPAGRIVVEFVGRVPEVRMAPEGVQEELAAFLDVRVPGSLGEPPSASKPEEPLMPDEP